MTQAPETQRSQRPAEDGGLNDLGEDTTGFGRLELRTLKDGLLRPAAVLEAYMTQGPTGGGQYARPLRLYLTLCGILMVQLFVMGGTTIMFAGLPPGALDPFIAESGKSRDAFLADADGWMSLVLVPINSFFYAALSTPLLRWWDSDNLGWRKSFRATFHYLNVWTLPFLPLAFLSYIPQTALWASLGMLVLGFISFLRVGKGRWYRTTLGGLVKAAAITGTTFIATLISTFPMLAIGVAGGIWG